jgi:ubiquinone biosynthesis protein
MIPPDLIPTRLVDPSERRPIALVAPAGTTRFRTLRIVFSLLKMLAGLGWLYLRGKLTPEAAGRRVRIFLEQHGFLWVKVGQLFSLRTDVLGRDFCRELAHLQFQARGFPLDLARQTLEQELGCPIEQVFSELDEHPFAAASISQVHRAVLRSNGVVVAVKVQRPDIGWLFARDMNLLRALIGLIRWLGIASYMRWDDMIWELNQIVLEEIDYRYETSNLRRMAKTLRAHKVFVPEVFEGVSTSRILVMEFIQGALMSDFIRLEHSDPGRINAWLEENNIAPRKVGRRLYVSFLRQLLEENLFHGDLHPGNIILLRDSRFAFIDLGTVGTVETDFLLRYLMYMQALAKHQHDRAADLMLLGCPDLPPVDLPALREQLARCIHDWEARSSLPSAPYSERSMESLATQSNQVLFASRVVISMMYLKLGRSWGTLDASLAHLIPNANYTRLIQRYFRSARKRSRRKSDGGGRFMRSVVETYQSATEVSQVVGPMLQRGAMIFHGGTTALAFCLGTLCRGLRLGLAIVGLAWLVRLLVGQFPGWLASSRIAEVAVHLARYIPAPGDARWQLLGCLAFVVFWVSLGKIQRRLMQEEILLPRTMGFPGSDYRS